MGLVDMEFLLAEEFYGEGSRYSYGNDHNLVHQVQF